jgi:hypothetical protein
MQGSVLLSNEVDRRPRLARAAETRGAARPVARFTTKAPPIPFARPPHVTSGQLLRISLLILASLIYSDPSPFFSGRLVAPKAQKIAAHGVDHTPTSAIRPAAAKASKAR